MVLKATVTDIEDVDENLRSEYKEVEIIDPSTKAKTKVFALDIEGHDSHPGVRKLKHENGQFRISARDANSKLEKFKIFGDRDPAEIQADLERIPELEQLAEGKMDDNKINSLVDTRIKSRLAPIERERDTFKTKAQELEGKVGEYSAREKRRIIVDAVRKEAIKQKVRDSAMEDLEMYADRIFDVDDEGRVFSKDGVGVTPGADPSMWLAEMQPKRPHWWGDSETGGARGGRKVGAGGTNPWTLENWNMAEQGQIFKADRARAEQLAKSAGTTIGGAKPPAKK